MNLTPKQQALLGFITDYQEQNNYAPSQKEIAKHFGYSSLGTVQSYLKNLESKGYLSKTLNGQRSLSVTEHFQDAVRIRLAGTVAAGSPIEAIECYEHIDVPSSLLKGGENFALRVRGDSMIEDGIHDGDIVVVRKQYEAKQGQTIVAILEGSATVKKFFKNSQTIELRPANQRMRPILVSPGRDFNILGVVVGLIRQYQF